jgi:nucleotide-binding universal stress UspA family protein
MRIICWHSCSEPARDAAEAARLLAGRFGDTVQLLEAAPDRSATLITPARAAALRVHAAGDANGGAAVATATATATAAPPLEIAPEVVEGPLEDCIRHVAAPGQTRLIVVPWADGAAAHVWLRPTPVQQIALSAPVPTLIVRDAAPLAAWARGQRRLRVWCAHDLTASCDHVLQTVREFCSAAPCDIVVAHVYRPLQQSARLGLPAHPTQGCEHQIQRILRHDLEERVQRFLGGLTADIRVCPARLQRDQSVLELARQEHADLIVAGTHQRHGLDRLTHPLSVSRALLRSAPANVLLVPTLPERPVRRVAAISRVLVATDLTPEGDQAVPHGYALLPYGGELRLLHVVHPLALPGGEFDDGISRKASHARHVAVLQEAENRLRELALGEDDAPGVATDVEVAEHREPAIAIAQAAERFRADVVCLAAQETSGVFDHLFKSQLRTVMARTHRPLLIVHPPSP